ncbi:MAG: hypothetical protein U0163_01320 [Gemmatimonadaceae bacterium]
MIRPSRIIALGGLAFLAASCRSFEPGVALVGTWGGQDISLELTATGGTISHGCAGGSLAEPLVPDNSGRVHATGEEVAGMGAPPPPGYIPPRYAVRYDGRVDGNRLTLTVTPIDNPSLAAKYTAVRGRAPQIYYCP